MATANEIAGTLKGTTLVGGESFHGDIAILTAIALAQQEKGDQNHEGWWGTHVVDLKPAATFLLVAHQNPGGTDPAYQTSAYKTGRYFKYLAQATAAAASATAINNHQGNPVQDSPIGQATSGLFHGLNLEQWILRIGEIILGVVLIGVGLAKLTGTTNVVSKVLKVV